jgi:hypothetical protein
VSDNPNPTSEGNSVEFEDDFSGETISVFSGEAFMMSSVLITQNPARNGLMNFLSTINNPTPPDIQQRSNPVSSRPSAPEGGY